MQIKTRAWMFKVWLLLAVLNGVPALRTAYADDFVTSYQAAKEEAAPLLQAHQFGAAIKAYSRWKNEFGKAVHEQAQAAQRAGKSDDASQFYRAYFQYFPFGGDISWSNSNWSDVARDYMALLGKRRDDGRVISLEEERELAASQTYYTKPDKPSDQDGATTLREQRLNALLEKFPNSLFVPLAVESLGEATNRFGDKTRAWRQKLESIKVSLHQAGATRNEFLVGSILLNSLGTSQNSVEEMLATHNLIDNLRALAAFDFEQRILLLRRASIAWATTDYYFQNTKIDPLELRVRLYRDVVQQYPGTTEAHEAEIGVLQSMLRAKRFDQALATFRASEKAAPAGQDFSEPLLILAAHYARWENGKLNSNWPESQALYEEIIRRGFSASDSAHLRLGHLILSLGKNDQAASHFLAAYESATAKPSTPRPVSAMGDNYIAHEAARSLATIAEKKADWNSALKWWQTFKPYGWCGNGVAALQNEKDFHIALCLQRLKNTDEAIKTLEPYVTRAQFSVTPETIKFLLDLFQQIGQITALERKAKDAIADPESGKYNQGAKLALEEIAARRNIKAITPRS